MGSAEEGVKQFFTDSGWNPVRIRSKSLEITWAMAFLCEQGKTEMRYPCLKDLNSQMHACEKGDRKLPAFPYIAFLKHLNNLSGPYRAMRAAMRCERRCVVNTEWRCDAMQKSWRCAFSLRKSSAMRSHDAKTLAMRCRDASHSVNNEKHTWETRLAWILLINFRWNFPLALMCFQRHKAHPDRSEKVVFC